MVAMNRLTGHSPGFFSVYSMPPNQAVSIARQRRNNRRLGLVPEYREVAGRILRKTRSLLRDVGRSRPRGRCRGLLQQDGGEKFECGGEVVLAVTSPPFLDVVDYRQDNWLRCWFAGVEAGQLRTTQTARLEEWKDLVRAVLGRVGEIMAPGGVFAFEVGEVRGGKVELDREVVAVAAGAGWDPACVVVNEQRFTKTANTWGVRNNRAGTNSNRVVVLRKPARG